MAGLKLLYTARQAVVHAGLLEVHDEVELFHAPVELGDARQVVPCNAMKASITATFNSFSAAAKLMSFASTKKTPSSFDLVRLRDTRFGRFDLDDSEVDIGLLVCACAPWGVRVFEPQLESMEKSAPTPSILYHPFGIRLAGLG